MTSRVAIILHGPPCAGKSSVAKELERRLLAAHITLDDGWLPGEDRYRGGQARYADLFSAPEPVLILEIACGEPPDLISPGATRGAAEWISVLRAANREIFPFLIWAEFSDVVGRLDARLDKRIREGSLAPQNKLFLLWQFLGLYSLYEHRHSLATFPHMPNFAEQTVLTTGRTIQQVVEEIMDATRLT